jgi:septal ring factor EnvC (AmiA/AmiB activator)
MADMRTAILGALDVYKTKDKADAYLSQSIEKQEEAIRTMADASEALEAVQSECAVLRQQISLEQASWKSLRETQQAELDAREKTCQAQAQALDALNAKSLELTVREGVLLAAQDAVTKRGVLNLD